MANKCNPVLAKNLVVCMVIQRLEGRNKFFTTIYCFIFVHWLMCSYLVTVFVFVKFFVLCYNCTVIEKILLLLCVVLLLKCCLYPHLGAH